MKVFLSGGTGVIGSRVVSRLVQAGHSVSVMSRSAAKADAIGSWGATPVGVSLFDPEGLRAAVAGHDVVINLATHIPPVTKAASLKSWAENDRIRTEGSRNLVDAALANGIGRFLQESIAFLHEDGGDAWLDEDAPVVDASTPVIGAALQAETQAARMTESGGVGVVLRFGFFLSADNNFIPAFLAATRAGRLPLSGPADAYWPAVHLDDAADAVVAALDAPAGVYHVVDDEPLTRAGWAQALTEALDDPGRVRVLGPLANGVMTQRQPRLATSQRCSNRRLREATGWAPRYPSVRETFAQIVPARREPSRVRSGAVMSLLAVLGLTSLLLGLWATPAPSSFYATFPFGRAWVAADGPYNEHLLRDFGGLQLALGAMTLVAAVTMIVPLVRAVAVGILLFGVPHLLYHATHLGVFASADQVASIMSLSAVVLAAIAVLILSRRRPPAPAADRATTASRRRPTPAAT